MYDRGPSTVFRDSEGHVRLNVSCTQETIHWMVMSNDPSDDLDAYRVEYTCPGVEVKYYIQHQNASGKNQSG